MLPILEPFHLKLAPGGTPLPGSVTGSLAKTGVGLPPIGHVLLDKLGVLPTVFHDYTLDRHVHHGVRSRHDIQMQTAVFFSVGHPGGAPRVNHDDLGVVTINAFENPVVPQRGLGLERIGARYQHTIRQRKVLMRGAKNIVANIYPPGG